MDNELIETVNTVLRDKFELTQEQLVPTALLKEDLKLDSLDFVDMFVQLEERVGGDIKSVELMKIRTLGDIYDIVKTLKTQGSSSPH